MKASKVFISYPSESKNEAMLLVEYLKKHQTKPIYIDWAEIVAGESIAERLKEGISESACCVFLLNTYSLKSEWCMAEVGAFWGASRTVIVYPIQPHCEVPPLLVGLRRANSPKEIVDACRRIPDPVKLDPSILETMSANGLTQAFRIPADDYKRQVRVKQLVEAERRRVGGSKFRLAASSGYNYLHPNGIVWKSGLGEAIEAGAEFLVVLESPFSDFAITRALANNVGHHHWAEKLMTPELVSMVQTKNVRIRVTERAMNCSLFLTSDAVFYDPYLWALPKPGARTENNFWVFEFDKGKPDSQYYDPYFDCYSLLEKHFEFLVHHSSTLEEFMGNNFDRYREYTDKFLLRVQAVAKGEPHVSTDPV